MMRIVLLLALVFLGACQTKPTQMGTTTEIPLSAEQVEEKTFREFLKLRPVILDARSSLDFTVSHPPGAISVNWEDFSSPDLNQRGWLMDDELSIARRLSLWGIEPKTPVLVVGYGADGKGEEGRLAWMLRYLGVEDVKMAHWSQVRSTIPREESPPENKNLWTPNIQKNWQVSATEFNKNVFEGPRPSSKARKDALQLPGSAVLDSSSVIVLDVSKLDVTIDKKLVKSRVPVKNLHWKKFITKEGWADPSVKAALETLGVTPKKTIYVVSRDGISSGLVTFVLREWNFDARHFSGGFQYLETSVR